MFATVLIVDAGSPTLTTPAAAYVPRGACGPMDVALLLDSTSSMDPAIDEVKNNLAGFVDQIEEASGGDYRLGLIEFGSGVTVHAPFAPQNANRVRRALPNLSQGGGDTPEDADLAMDVAVDNRGRFSVPWREEASRIIVLVTDARPAGGDDAFDSGVDDVRMWNAAERAMGAGTTVGTFFVPNGNHEPEAAAILEDTARRGGGPFLTTSADATNLDDGLELLITGCGADSDGDGLYDLWESDGYDADGDGTIDVDLPAMGADPQHKDLFIQVNWMSPDGVVPCYFIVWCPGVADGPHPPRPEALERVVSAFADAPVDNPDGEPGVAVHFDAGDLTPESGVPDDQRQGGPLPVHRDGFLASNGSGDFDYAPLVRAKAEAMDDARTAVFTFIYYVHRIEVCEDCSQLLGLAAGIPSDSLVVSGTRLGSVGVEAMTVMHELGHTFGLGHGGADHINGKPNYLSIMNYAFAHREGLLVSGGEPVLDYSRFALGPLDERGALDEADGIPGADAVPQRYRTIWFCNGEQPEIQPVQGPKDWDCSGDERGTAVSTPIHAVRLEHAGMGGCSRADGHLRRLCSQDDWASLVFTGGVRGGLEQPSQPVPGGEQQFTVEEYLATPRDHGVFLEGGGSYGAEPGTASLQIPFLVTNTGTQDDTVAVDVAGTAAWEDPALSAPPSLALGAGEQAVLPVDVTIPEDAEPGDRVDVELTVQSEALATATSVCGASVEVVEHVPRRLTEGELTVDGAPASPGDEITLSGAGFSAASPATAWFEDDDVVGSVLTDDRGAVELTVTVPDIEPGQRTVNVMAATADGRPLLLSAVVEIQGGSSDDEGPTDDGDDGGGSSLAIVLLGAGAVVLLALGGLWWRRRRRGPQEA